MTAETDSLESSARAGRGAFRSLQHRNFKWFWTGAFLSNTGTWMQTVAQGWLVLELTNSAFWLGLDAFMATVPGFLLTLVGGVYADWLDRRKLLLWTQVVAGSAALLLGALVVTGVVQVWMILLLSFVTGCCVALSSPSYQAFTFDLVGRDDVPNAIALNSTQFQLSRVVGPMFAALAIKAFGLAGCFFANGLSFIAIIFALMQVRLDSNRNNHTHGASSEHAVWSDLVAGFRYVQQRPRVRMLLLISSFTSLFGAPYMALMPLFARNVHRLGETGLAVMMGTVGAGAFCGALSLVFFDIRRKGWFVLGGAWIFAICLMGFALATNPLLALVMLFGVGYAIVASVAVTNMLLQQIVTDEMRGRVMSMFVFSFLGVVPFGNFIAGAAAERYGAPLTLACGGLITALFITVVGFYDERLRTS